MNDRDRPLADRLLCLAWSVLFVLTVLNDRESGALVSAVMAGSFRITAAIQDLRHDLKGAAQ